MRTRPVREAEGMFEIDGGIVTFDNDVGGKWINRDCVSFRNWNLQDTCIKKLVLVIELRCFNHKVLQ